MFVSDSKIISSVQAQAEKVKVSETEAQHFMNRNVVLIQQGTKIFSAVQTLSTHRISGAPVVDRSDRLVGVVTEHDLLLQVSTKDVIEPIVFTKDPVTVTPTTKVSELIVVFYKKKIRWAPVVDDKNHVLGIVTRLDVLTKLLEKGK